MLKKLGSKKAVSEEMARRGRLAKNRYLKDNPNRAREMAQKRWNKYYAEKGKSLHPEKEGRPSSQLGD